MKFHYLLPLLLSLLTLACDKEGARPVNEEFSFTCLAGIDTNLYVQTNFCEEGYFCDFTVFPRTSIDTSLYRRYDTITNDFKNAFVLHRGFSHPIIRDFAWTQIIIFEIDNTETRFTAEDEQLSNLNVYFLGGPRFYIHQKPGYGCLQGEKQEDGSWLIEGELTFEPSLLRDGHTERYRVRASE